MKNNPHSVTKQLINWFSKAKRPLPWRQSRDPYYIWLSEIILQQTRVEQGLPYYHRFIEQFPDIKSMADASETQILKCWEGLGYYSRARNLHETAKYVAYQLNGQFPDNYHELLKLKGIGPYTAAAIASIAFHEPVPVVDGNVFRFISRYFGIEADISKPATRKIFSHLLSDLIDSEHPGEFNQACMEYGALICTPSAPQCEHCEFRLSCFAFNHQKQNQLPVKTAKTKIQHRYYHYYLILHEDRYLLKKRTENIWRGLYDFYLLDTKTDKVTLPDFKIDPVNIQIEIAKSPIKHVLSHRILWVYFHRVVTHKISDFVKIKNEFELMDYSKEEMLTLPFPKVIVNYLEQGNF